MLHNANRIVDHVHSVGGDYPSWLSMQLIKVTQLAPQTSHSQLKSIQNSPILDLW